MASHQLVSISETLNSPWPRLQFISEPFHSRRLREGLANTCWQGEPLILTSYVGIFPLFIIGVIAAEMHLQRYPVELLFPAIGVAALHLVVKRLQTGPDEVPEEMEGYETEFQLLGLSS